MPKDGGRGQRKTFVGFYVVQRLFRTCMVHLTQNVSKDTPHYASIEYWIKRCLFGYREALWLDRIRIYGTSEFRDRTIQALGLLEESGESKFISTALTEICQGLCSSGYILPRGTATYVVGEFTWKLAPAGYASMIAHHAFRKKAYESDVGPVDPSTEVDCFAFQATILVKLQASNEEYDEATGLSKSETSGLFDTKETQKSYVDDRKRRYGLLRYILPESLFYSVVEHRGIRIQGSEEFIAHSCRALELLAKIPEWSIIAENLRKIKQSSKFRTYIRTGGKRKGVVTVSWPGWCTSAPETYAGVIAHEAYHNQMSREPEATMGDATGIEEERRCVDFEIRVLEKLGNAEDEIESLRIIARFPTHAGSKENLFDLIWR